MSLDEFGTGYASLQHLRLLPINSIKIDRSFVQGLLSNESDRILVRSMMGVAAAFGIEVIAEGVENEAQRVQLHTAGCRQGQGWLFAHPMAEDRLLALWAPGPPQI